MRKHVFKLFPLSLIIALMVVCRGNAQTAGNISRTVLHSLGAGEMILSSECCFALSVTQNQVYLVTRLNDKFFIYENGQRKGPFTDLGKAGVKPCGAQQANDKCSLYKPQQVEIPSNEVSIDEMGRYVIKIKGKNYGPYQFLKNIHIFPDKSGFVAISMELNMKSTLITSEGPAIPLNGNVDEIQISPNGKKYVFALKESENIDPVAMAEKMSKMTQEQLLKFVQEMEEQRKNAGSPKAYVYVSGGGKFGPYEQSPFYANNPAFTKTGGDNWIMTIDNALYINGTKVKTFENFDLNTCNIWVSKDGKKYAVTSYDQIIFSDGKTFKNPLETSSYEKDGKTFLKWASLENEKDLVIYSREI